MNNAPTLFLRDGLWNRLCAVCNKPMQHKYKSQLRNRTCSHRCQLKGNTFRSGHIPKNAYKKGETTGEKNFKWKGDKVGYFGVHDWVQAYYGKPLECEQCGFTSENTYQFNWCNISKKYKRDRTDWLRLCRKCHHKFDNISEKMWRTRKSKV